jgi:DNA-binding NarL/FixJ family response regulator
MKKKEQATWKVYLVDDHPIVRMGIEQIVNAETDMEVCGASGNAEDALRDVSRLLPHLMIADISLSGTSGIELVRALKTRFPEVKAIILTMHDEAIYAERAIRAGARGYIMKRELSEKIVEAIRQVMAGRIFLSENMSAKFIERFAGNQPLAADSPLHNLTDRELEVFRYIGRGYSPRDIARVLNLRVKTIDAFRERLKKKLNVSSSAELTRFAVEWHIREGPFP